MKLKRSLQCEECCKVLYTYNAQDFRSLIAVKNNGKLSFPSKDVFTLCIVSEKLFSENVLQSGKSQQYSEVSNFACHAIVVRVLSELQNKAIFSDL